jgi:hypothetical protein
MLPDNFAITQEWACDNEMTISNKLGNQSFTDLIWNVFSVLSDDLQNAVGLLVMNPRCVAFRSFQMHLDIFLTSCNRQFRQMQCSIRSLFVVSCLVFQHGMGF